jgi:ABC-type branched-subunit amino acid transport system substrate-binding protein
VPVAEGATTTVGVTRDSVAVVGLVGAGPATTGADLGAKARFERANRRGVAGREIRYGGNAADAGSAATTAFAVVPAASDTLDVEGLTRAAVPFVGAASTAAWNDNRFGFGFVGVQEPVQTRAVSPAWGMLLRSLLGTAQGSQVALVVDAGATGDARAAQARASLRGAGFRVAEPVVLPAPPAALPDLAPVVTNVTTGAPAAVLVLTAPTTTTALAQRLAAAGFTGTVAADASQYQPAAPAAASGLTVLVPYAPLEETTAANRQMARDVEAVAPGTALTPGIAAGYWSADLFVAMLQATGKQLTRARFLAVARKFSHVVASTVGPVRWPAMASQAVPCGALVQSDGSRYLVAEPYGCGKPVRARSAT